MSRHRPLLQGLIVAALALAAVGCSSLRPTAQAPELYEARLAGSQEVPAVASAGQGVAEVRYDPRTGLLHWRVVHAGLSGPVVAGHIHGPAGPGQVAPPVLPLGAHLDAPPVTGQARITPEQLTQLASGQWYVNLHTARHPAGEIRGQLRPRAD